MAYGKQFAVLMEKRDEIDMRVPNDGLDTSWKQFSDKELEETILPKYRGYKKETTDLPPFYSSSSSSSRSTRLNRCFFSLPVCCSKVFQSVSNSSSLSEVS